MTDSLFRIIYKNIGEDGCLKKGFSLPKEEASDGIRFADGALDGITVYHSYMGDLDEGAKEALSDLLNLVSEGKFDEAEEGFKAFCEDHRAITIIDDIQIYMQEHDGDYSDENFYNFSVKMLMESMYTECVKVGMSILEMYNTYENRKLSDVIRILSLSDEFALFGSFIMRDWPDAEHELLKAASRVRGWGRIHLVESIGARNEETKKWLLVNGIDNDVMSAYSAYTVFVKADVPEVLKKEDLKLREYQGIIRIAAALLGEGPVQGISRLEDPEGFLSSVIGKSSSFELDEDDEKILENLRKWGRDE